MSYSRWINSSWYVFWTSSSSNKKEEQTCEIMYSVDERWSISYGELVRDFEGVMKSISHFFPNATGEEIKELRGYLLDFMDDVEKEM
jgi:hypothetical protein